MLSYDIVWICISIYISIGNTVRNYRHLLSSRHLLVMQNRRKKDGRHLLQGATATAKVNKHILRREMRIDFHLSKCPPSYHLYIRKKIGIHHWADIIKYVPQKIPPLLPQRISGRLADSSRKHVTNHPERLMSKITGSKFRKPKAIYKQQITFFHPHLLLKTPGPSHLRCSSTGRRISGHHADLGKNEATRP